MPTWEQAEGEMQRLALNHALSKLERGCSDLGLLFAGDLITNAPRPATG